MIKSVRDRAAATIADGKVARKLPQDMQRNALKQLLQLDAAAVLAICAFRPATVWKHCTEIVRGSTAFVSTTNGASVSASRLAMPTM